MDVEDGLSDQERLIRYGACEHCGEPRDVRQFMVGLTVHVMLWCPSCGREAE